MYVLFAEARPGRPQLIVPVPAPQHRLLMDATRHVLAGVPAELAVASNFYLASDSASP